MLADMPERRLMEHEVVGCLKQEIFAIRCPQHELVDRGDITVEVDDDTGDLLAFGGAACSQDEANAGSDERGSQNRPAQGAAPTRGGRCSYRCSSAHHVKKTPAMNPHSRKPPPNFMSNPARIWSVCAEMPHRRGNVS